MRPPRIGSRLAIPRDEKVTDPREIIRVALEQGLLAEDEARRALEELGQGDKPDARSFFGDLLVSRKIISPDRAETMLAIAAGGSGPASARGAAPRSRAPEPDDAATIPGAPSVPPDPHLGPAAPPKFLFGQTLGKGGRGEVTAASDALLRREVAIKRLLDPGDAGIRSRFVEEAQITGQLEHPNIIPVHELGFDDSGAPFLVMKRVKGRSLAQVLSDVAAGGSVRLRTSGPGSKSNGSGKSRKNQALGDGESGAAKKADESPEGGRTIRASEEPEKALSWLLQVFSKVCEAVAYAHWRGVVHRDLKPDNVMVGEFGEVLVMDWGLAKVIGDRGREDAAAEEAGAARTEGYAGRNRDAPRDRDEDDGQDGKMGATALHETLREDSDVSSAGRVSTDRRDEIVTIEGDVLGTPQYMSPEQARGSVGEISARSDVYSLGAILYEILSLNRPFDGATVHEVLDRVEKGSFEPPSGRSRAPWDIPREMEAVALKAMSLNPVDRYGGALEIAEEVQAYFAGRRLRAAEYSVWQVLAKWARRNRAAVATGAGMAVLLAAATTVFVAFLAMSRAEALRQKSAAISAEGEARVQADRAERSRARAEELRVEAETRVAEGLLQQGKAFLEAGDFAQADRSFEDARERFAALSLPVERADWGLLDSMMRSPPPLLMIKCKTGYARCLQFMPDGRRFLAGGIGHPLTLFDALTGRVEREFDVFPGVSEFRILPGADKVLVGGNDGGVDRGLALVGLDDGAVERRFDAALEGVLSLCLFQGGESFVAGTPDGFVLAMETRTGRLLWRERIYTREITSLSISPDSKHLHIGKHERVLALYDPASGKRTRLLGRESESILRSIFLPDGRLIVTPSNRLQMWDADRGQMERKYPGHKEEILRLAEAGPNRFLSSGVDHVVRMWDIAEGEERRAFRGHSAPVWGLAVSPDGRHFASSDDDGLILVWDLEHGAEWGALRGHVGGVARVAVSSDGRRILTGSYSAAACVWDAKRRVRLKTLSGHEGQIDGVAFSPDGWVAATASADRTARTWDVSSGSQLVVFTGNEGMVMSVDFSPDGKLLMTGGQDGTVRLYDAATGEPARVLKGHTDWFWVGSVKFTPDGRGALTSGRDAYLNLWNLETGEVERRMTGHSSLVGNSAISPDGEFAASGGRDQTTIKWDLKTGLPVWVRKASSTASNDLCFSPDGGRLIVTRGDGLELLDASNGSLLHAFRGACGRFALLPGGRVVVVGLGTGEVVFLDFDRPARMADLGAAAENAVKALARDPDDAGALADLGRWYAFRGDWVFAEAALSRASELGLVKDRALLGSALWHTGRFSAAAEQVRLEKFDASAADPDLSRHLDLCLSSIFEQEQLKIRMERRLELVAPAPWKEARARLEHGTDEDGRKVVYYRFRAVAGDRIRVSVRSAEFKPRFVIWIPGSKAIQAVLPDTGLDEDLDFRLPLTGEYAIGCANAGPGDSGEFKVRFEVR